MQGIPPFAGFEGVGIPLDENDLLLNIKLKALNIGRVMRASGANASSTCWCGSALRGFDSKGGRPKLIAEALLALEEKL